MSEIKINKNDNFSDEVLLKDVIIKIRIWFKYLYSKWYFILLAVIIGAFLGFGYSYTSKPVFIAETTFVLEDENSAGGMGQIGGLIGLVGLESGSGGIFQGDNIFQLYRSNKLVEKTLLTPMMDGTGLLVKRYIDFMNLDEKWRSRPELLKIDFRKQRGVRVRDSIIIEIINDINRNNLIVSRPDKKLNVISIKIKSPDEKFSKEFVEALVNNVNQFYIETKTKKSLQNLIILQKQTDSVRSVLNGDIKDISYTTDETPNINLSRQKLRVPVQLTQIDIEANRTILNELVKNLEMTKMSFRKTMPLIQIIDSPIYPLKKEIVSKINSSILGAFLGGVLIVFFFTIRSALKNIF